LLLADHGAQAAPEAEQSPYDLIMTAEDIGPTPGAVSPRQGVGLFLLLTVCLSGIFWVLINATQTANPYYVGLLMWMPGVSALLACRILRRPLSILGLDT
jgi:hypothetical protein